MNIFQNKWIFHPGRVSLFCDPFMMLEIVVYDLSTQESLPRKGNINFPGRESFPFLKGGFPWQVNPSLVKKKFPTREIASLAVKLIPNIGK